MRHASYFVGLLTVVAAFGVSTRAPAAERSIDPARLKDNITLPLGRKIIVEFEQHGDALSHPAITRNPSGKKPAVLFDFRDRGGNLYMLVIKNTFPKAFRFRALTRPKGQNRYFETSILFVFASLTNFESWHERFSELVLFDFKLTDERFQSV